MKFERTLQMETTIKRLMFYNGNPEWIRLGLGIKFLDSLYEIIDRKA